MSLVAIGLQGALCIWSVLHGKGLYTEPLPIGMLGGIVS